jgi:hypothetical protein
MEKGTICFPVPAVFLTDPIYLPKPSGRQSPLRGSRVVAFLPGWHCTFADEGGSCRAKIVQSLAVRSIRKKQSKIMSYLI